MPATAPRGRRGPDRSPQAGGVEPAGAVAALLQQAGVLQHTQVLGHGLGGDVEVLGDLAGGQLAVADEGEDAPPLRFGERPEDGVGAHGLPAEEGDESIGRRRVRGDSDLRPDARRAHVVGEGLAGEGEDLPRRGRRRASRV